MSEERWDRRFLRLAETWANECSKDPSTKVGAVLVSPDRKQVILGYNGFPSRVMDLEERLNDRERKYRLMVHAEVNAILNAQRPLDLYTLYIYPIISCSACALLVIQSGIRRVVSYYPSSDIVQRWGDSLNYSRSLFMEAGIEVREYERL